MSDPLLKRFKSPFRIIGFSKFKVSNFGTGGYTKFNFYVFIENNV